MVPNLFLIPLSCSMTHLLLAIAGQTTPDTVPGVAGGFTS
ncbi:hypothetical protein SCH4B_0700 [Ruegeria sp. TrichCH4B]|nr:hypothetical protein SCH4B_0700 [Ruegeria sp. TrichCH4B]